MIVDIKMPYGHRDNPAWLSIAYSVDLSDLGPLVVKYREKFTDVYVV